MCVSDFNEIVYAHEKKRGQPANFKDMQAFRHALEVQRCGFYRLQIHMDKWSKMGQKHPGKT